MKKEYFPKNDKKRIFVILLYVLGFIFVALGIVGILIPLLPTTPFLLLAASCFASSSPKYYQWLLNNKWFGVYIKNYKEKKGIPLRIKIISISTLWITIIISALFSTENLWIRILLVIIAIAVSVHIISIKPNR